MFILILLILPSIFAVEINLKDQFNQGETIIATVSGTFISPLTKNNVLFYREHTRIPIEYDVFGADGVYYIYALLADKSPGEYSLSIENAQYTKGTEVTNQKIVKNFSITSDIADFSVNPGFVFPSGDFSIKIKNLQETQIIVDIKTNLGDLNERKISISSPEISNEASVQLISGQEKQINFKLSSGLSALNTISLQTNNTSYEIPVVLLSNSEGNQESTFSLEPSRFIYTFPTNSQIKKIVYLYNTGDSEMKNISISLSDSLKQFVNTSISKIEKLAAGSNVQFELIFSSKAESEIEGELKAKTGETITYSSISLKFVNNYVVPLNQSGQSSTKSCAELQGTLCNKDGFKCSKEMISSGDGWCCKGNCSAIGEDSTGKIIAIVITVGLVLGIGWFYFKKYKKAKNPVNLLEISKGKKGFKQ